ncbi:hypothetical protein [Pseudidiomarina mangrovi]|uniref:hypothetical protein n=1 Tax=Pseudidiomarina mangrovi TaxID=2487133 RepID=UPI000FCCBA8C|nr:hypothetical protein [Pseudidiomarina mangrovi]
MESNQTLNIPVMLDVFCRPEKLEIVFEVLKRVKPSILFLVSDGPRVGNQEDVKLISKSRQIVSDIDWDCDVHRLYFDTNMGLYRKNEVALDYIFDRVDRLIFLEDDIVADASFFYLCEDLLERYKSDLRINMICGHNPLGSYDKCPYDYFFSEAASIWGVAFWRRTYELFKMGFSYQSNLYERDLLRDISRDYKRFSAQLSALPKFGFYKGHPAGLEFWLRLNNVGHSQLNIIVSRNMISNIGFGHNASHASPLILMPRKIQRLFNMDTFNVRLPLKHPPYIINDKVYRNKIWKLIYGGRFESKLLRPTESVLRYLAFGSKKIMFSKILNRIRPKQEK